jgi:hypothetical protein
MQWIVNYEKTILGEMYKKGSKAPRGNNCEFLLYFFFKCVPVAASKTSIKNLN